MKIIKDGSWIIWLAVVLTAGAVGYQVMMIRPVWGSRAVGDGQDPASYGFDLQSCVIDCDEIVASGSPRDRLHALVDPATLPLDEAAAIHEGGHGNKNWLLPDDPVVGVAIGDAARAYPVSILDWHEIVNDTVGGVPVAVTWHALTGGAVVFDRRVGGETLAFGWSGLLVDSGLLMYERRDEGGESLWSQLQARAVAGPAAGTDLQTIPVSVVRWADWSETHPDSDVLAPDPSFKKLYREKLYESYRGSSILRFPVDPLPDDEELALKTPLVVVTVAGERAVYPVPTIYENAGENGAWIQQQAGHTVRLETSESPTVFVDVTPATADVSVLHAYWFAWHASHPDDVPVL